MFKLANLLIFVYMAQYTVSDAVVIYKVTTRRLSLGGGNFNVNPVVEAAIINIAQEVEENSAQANLLIGLNPTAEQLIALRSGSIFFYMNEQSESNQLFNQIFQPTEQSSYRDCGFKYLVIDSFNQNANQYNFCFVLPTAFPYNSGDIQSHCQTIDTTDNRSSYALFMTTRDIIGSNQIFNVSVNEDNLIVNLAQIHGENVQRFQLII